MNKKNIGLITLIYQLLILNLCFFGINVFFLFLNFGIKLSLLTIPLFGISSIFITPSVISLILILKESSQSTIEKPVQTYFKDFTTHFKKTAKYSASLVVILIILYTDALFFSEYTKLYYVDSFLVGMGFIVVLIFSRWLVEYSISNKDGFKNKSNFKLLLNLAFSDWITSILYASLMITLFLLMITKPTVGYLVAPSLIALSFIKINNLSLKRRHKSTI